MKSKHKLFLAFLNNATKDYKNYFSDALNRPMVKLRGNKTLERLQVNKIITFASIIIL
ncbi:MAG: hypothetical protein RJA90_258 [Bacteroidota bacterium]